MAHLLEKKERSHQPESKRKRPHGNGLEKAKLGQTEVLSNDCHSFPWNNLFITFVSWPLKGLRDFPVLSSQRSCKESTDVVLVEQWVQFGNPAATFNTN